MSSYRTLALCAILSTAIAPAARAQDVKEDLIGRSYAPIHTKVETWDGERPERLWQLNSTFGFGAQTIATYGPTTYAEDLYTTSFVATGTFELFQGRTTVWFHVPFHVTHYSPEDIDVNRQRDVFAFGNIAVEAGHQWQLGRDLGLRFTLIISSPTIIEEGELAFGGFHGDSTSANRSALASRGYETPELFKPGYIGFTPTLTLRWRVRSLRVEPYLKLASFVSPVEHPDERYRGEIVVGARATYRINNHFDAGLRVWGMLPVIAGDDPWALSAAAELRAYIGDFVLGVGATVPLYVPDTFRRVYGIALILGYAG
jgi:hypothetical protein